MKTCTVYHAGSRNTVRFCSPGSDIAHDLFCHCHSRDDSGSKTAVIHSSDTSQVDPGPHVIISATHGKWTHVSISSSYSHKTGGLWSPCHYPIHTRQADSGLHVIILSTRDR